MQKQDKILIGEIIVLPSHNKICTETDDVLVEPKIMEVLCYLVEHRDQVLSKQQILEALWPGQTIGQEVITRAIFELRKTLKDDAKQPRYISTIPRKGYCFIHPVTIEPVSQPLTNINSPSSSIRIGSLFVTLLLMCAVTIWLLMSDQSKQPTKGEASVSNFKQATIVSHGYQAIDDPNISPNGEYIVYVARENDQHLLVKTSINNLTQQVLVQSSNQFLSPIWLSNELMVFGECQQGRCQLVEYNLASGERNDFAAYNHVTGLSQAGETLLIAVIENGVRAFKLFSLSEQASIPVNIEIEARHPVLDPLLQQVYYYTRLDKGQQKLAIFDIETQKQRLLDVNFDRIFSLAIKSSGQILVSARREGSAGIWQYGIESQQLTKLVGANPGEVLSELNYSNTNSLLVYQKHKRNIDIVVDGLPIKHDHINSDMIDMNAVYAEKRQQLFFTSNRTGFYELWTSREGHLEKLTQLKANVIDRPVLSFEQDKLAFTTSHLNETYLNVFDIEARKIVHSYQLPGVVHLLSWPKGDNVFYSLPSQDSYAIYQYNLINQESGPVALDAGLMYHLDEQNGQFYGKMSLASVMQSQLNGEVQVYYQIPKSAFPLMPHQINIVDGVIYHVNNSEYYKFISSVSPSGEMSVPIKGLPADAYVTQLGKAEKTFVIYDQLINVDKQLILSEH